MTLEILSAGRAGVAGTLCGRGASGRQQQRPRRDIRGALCHAGAACCGNLPLSQQRAQAACAHLEKINRCRQVLERLQRPAFRAACPGTRVLLAPATRDAAAPPVFPQPPMTPPSTSAAAGITWLPNPAAFRLNEVRRRSPPTSLLSHRCLLAQHRTVLGQGVLMQSDTGQGAARSHLARVPRCQVVFGVVTSDVLMHLAGAEAQRGAGPDRMAALAGHLVAQRRCLTSRTPRTSGDACAVVLAAHVQAGALACMRTALHEMPCRRRR